MDCVDSAEKLHRVVNLKLALRVFVYVFGLLCVLFGYLLGGSDLPEGVQEEMVNKYRVVYIYDTESMPSDFFLERVLPSCRRDVVALHFFKDALDYNQKITLYALQQFEEDGYVASDALKRLHSSDLRLGSFTAPTSPTYCTSTALSKLSAVQSVFNLTYSFLATNPTDEINMAGYLVQYDELMKNAESTYETFRFDLISELVVYLLGYSLAYLLILWCVRVVPWVNKGGLGGNPYSNLDAVAKPVFETTSNGIRVRYGVSSDEGADAEDDEADVDDEDDEDAVDLPMPRKRSWHPLSKAVNNLLGDDDSEFLD